MEQICKNNLFKDKESVGVIIARMQVPYLTNSHKKLIETVISRHPRTIIFLGCTGKPIDKKNPFPFDLRKDMIYNTFSELSFFFNIIPLPDNIDNKMWVDTLDLMISSLIQTHESAKLYGGRDSFIPYYKKDGGKFECTELSPEDYDSGTELRRLSSIKQPKYCQQVAETILWALNNT